MLESVADFFSSFYVNEENGANFVFLFFLLISNYQNVSFFSLSSISYFFLLFHFIHLIKTGKIEFNKTNKVSLYVPTYILHFKSLKNESYK